MHDADYVIGADYGTDSVRILIVDAATGAEIVSAVQEYPRWKEGKYCDPHKQQFRQHPQDYLDSLEAAVKEALAEAPAGTAEKIRGISIDTTGSTPVAVDKHGTPLSLLDKFHENPNAMFILWKDHTAIPEAEEINTLAHSGEVEDYTKYIGGVYSSEWFWAKILHTLRLDEEVREQAFSWVEHCDWMPAVLTGKTDPLTMKRSRCASGHKAMWHESWRGLPPEEFFAQLDPLLEGLRDRLGSDETYPADVPFGNLSEEWAERLGLSTDVVVGVGAFDAHLGAVGAEIRPHTLCKVMGTSTCDMMIVDPDELGDTRVAGIAGQVDGSIFPGTIGLEAGQSAFGDVYAWFQEVLLWPMDHLDAMSSVLSDEQRKTLRDEMADNLIRELTAAAEKIPPGDSGVLALDWMNGRRTPYANQRLKGAIANLHLGTDAPRIFRALVEATAFGARKIADRFQEDGVRIDEVIALGGIPAKSPFVMQIVADVLNKPIHIVKSDQTPALGSAMAAATVAGLYDSMQAARESMGNGFGDEYHPNPQRVKIYEDLYREYEKFGEFVENELTDGINK